jgi:SAM-dependent methyltransferase
MERNASQPSAELLKYQAEWLAPARSRLLRHISVAHRRRILDLGAGAGIVTGELVRRGRDLVVALDLNYQGLYEIEIKKGLSKVAGDGSALPFSSASFDLAFCQCTLMWIQPLLPAVSSLWRVLEPGGVLVSLEPDYGGLIEYPRETTLRDIWLSALERSGADPFVGRRLPGMLRDAGFSVNVELLERLYPPSPLRFSFFEGMPLTEGERESVELARLAASQIPGSRQIAHLPYFLITAKKRR